MSAADESLFGLTAAIVGGGPAGLIAAEVLAGAGMRVDVYDAMPSVGRKFLLAGKGGLNLTHVEAFDAFAARFGSRRDRIEPMLRRFGPDAVRAFADGLGVRTFVGSSGRVFPHDLKAAPLLRAWLHRLRAAGVRFHMRRRWTGWAGALARDGMQALTLESPDGSSTVAAADAVVLALGGASWPQLGSNGAWVPLLRRRGVEVAPLRPSNCGFEVARRQADGTLQAAWSEHFRTRFEGAPLKNVAIGFEPPGRPPFRQAGEFVITAGGAEGSLIYALSALARDAIEDTGSAVLHIDLLPARSPDFVRAELLRPRGSRSLATHLKSRLGIDGVKAGLLHELLTREAIADPLRLAAAIKSLPLTLVAARPIEEAISSAGGVAFEALDDDLMLRVVPGVFCAGEMLDWEAPTGGYLLSACLASGWVAAHGVLRRLGIGTATTNPPHENER